MSKAILLGSASTLLLVTTVPAVAQTASGGAQATDQTGVASPQDETGLGDIIVTAQRRSESAQKVPIAVSALAGEQLDRLQINDAADLTAALPGVTMSPNGGRSTIFLRGVGNNSYSTAGSVLTFVDGVYQPFDNTAGADYNNIESLSLAKGPQGTLFGRNATGGVIQVTTKNPLDWQGLDAELGYANYNTFSARGYGAIKLSDRAAVDLAGFFLDQKDGWGTNIANGQDVYTARRYGFRSKLVAKLDDTFTATLAGDYGNRRGQVGALWSPAIGYSGIYVGGALVPLGPYDITSEMNPGYKSEEWGTSLSLEKRFGDVRLSSISAYRHVVESISLDADGGPTPFFPLNRADRRSVFTQELQLSGDSSSFHWVTGLWYFGQWAKNNGPEFGGAAATVIFGSPNGSPFTINANDHTNQFALYGQATINLLPSTRLTLGARYTIEKRQLEGYTHFGSLIVPGSSGTLRKTFRQPTFRVAIDHDLAKNVMVYASFSRGFNAGWFNQGNAGGFTPAANPLVEPEKLDAWEVGFKSDLLDRALRINVSGFHYDYANLQQQIYRNGTVSSINAASSTINGVDFDIVARPVSAFTFSVSGTYIDAKYKDYPLAPNYDYVPGAGVVATGAVNAKGKKLVVAPDFSLEAVATYSIRSSFGTIDATGSLNYVTRIYGDPQNEYFIPGRTLVGATLLWTSPDKKTSFSVWGKNLGNVAWDMSVTLVPPNGAIGQPGAPRTFGATIGRKF